MPRKLSKVKPVALFLDTTTQAVYDMSRKGLIPVVKLGPRQYRWDLVAVAQAVGLDCSDEGEMGTDPGETERPKKLEAPIGNVTFRGVLVEEGNEIRGGLR